jgi:hypothetical protein
VARPRFRNGPTADELLALNPVDRYVRITRHARDWGTLPKWMADMRKAALPEALAHPGVTATALAERAEQSLGRVSQLFNLVTGATAVGQET